MTQEYKGSPQTQRGVCKKEDGWHQAVSGMKLRQRNTKEQ